MANPPAGDGRRRRGGWVWGVVTTGVALQLVICVALVMLAPAALAQVQGKLGAFRSGLSSALDCPRAKASDAAPRDSSGQFTIQPVYAEALKYAGDAASQPSGQRVHLWAVDVLGQYPPMDDIFTEAVGGVDQWNASLSAIDPSAFRCVVRDMQAGDVAQQALGVLQADALQLPGPKTTAYLVPWNTRVFYGASGEQSLLIPFWEQSPLDRTLTRNPTADWGYLPFALDHEYLEVVRYDRLGSEANTYQTLLGNIVTDGLADNFAEHETGRTLDYGISPTEEASLWSRFQSDLNQIANANERAEMLGDPAQGIPNGAGYQMGDHIVALYLRRHPNATFNQLVGMSAQTIFAGSGYTG